MERVMAVFICLAAAAGFGYGLLSTSFQILPALGGAVIFGIVAVVLAGMVAVLVEVVFRRS